LALRRDCPKGIRHDWSDAKVPGDMVAGSTLHYIRMINPENFILRQCNRCFSIGWFYGGDDLGGVQPPIKRVKLSFE